MTRRAGMLKRVHSHGFSNTHATELRSEGVDVGIVSKQLGHNDGEVLESHRPLDRGRGDADAGMVGLGVADVTVGSV